MAEENAGGQETTLTPDQAYDAAFKAYDAWQANPSDETKKAVDEARSKATTIYASAKKSSDEALAKFNPPQKYDIKLPNDSKLDAEAVKGIAEYAKAQKLTQAQAQALLERESANFAAYVEGQKKQWEEEQAGWADAIAKDKEIGGEKTKEAVEVSKKVLQKFGSPELVKELESSGLGNHPELVRLLFNVGKSMSNDKLVVGNARDNEERKSTKDILFPEMAGTGNA